MCLSCGCGRPGDAHEDPRNITLLVLQGAADAAGITAAQAAANIVTTLRGDVRPGPMEKALEDEPADSAWSLVIKAQEERRYTLGLAWPALRADVGKAVDGRRDIARPEVVERTAWAWMAKSRQVGLLHADGTEGHGTVVESYIYRGPDWTITAVDGSEQLIKSGHWLAGVIWDEVAWGLVKKGFIEGFSPQGRARRRPASADLIKASQELRA
jgi:hypothetical protein